MTREPGGNLVLFSVDIRNCKEMKIDFKLLSFRESNM